MSGGGFDYLHAKDAGERLELLRNHADGLVSDLRSAEVAAAQFDAVWKTKTRVITPDERRALCAAASEVTAIAESFDVLNRRVEAFVGVLHALDYTRSCDWSESTIWDACAKWAAGRADGPRDLASQATARALIDTVRAMTPEERAELRVLLG